MTGTPDHKIDEQLDAVSQNGHLAAFIAHTKASVEANPHVLLAYAWVLYMALFSGGRYLRAALQSASSVPRPDFWTRDPRPCVPTPSPPPPPPPATLRALKNPPTPTSPRTPRPKTRSETSASKQVPGLQFFNFASDEDGEDIKLEIKKRITEAEILLTAGEKGDIISEAEEIFKFLVEMVEELDSVMGRSEEDGETARLAREVSWRDSVVAVRERLVRRTRSLSVKAEERARRRSSLDVYFWGLVGILVRFAGDMPPVRLFRRTRSRLEHNGKGEKSDLNDKKRTLGLAYLKLSTLVPILAVLMLFWFGVTCTRLVMRKR